MTTYAFRTSSGDVLGMFPEFAPPTPLHALTEAAERGREAVRRVGLARRVDRIMEGVVTEIPPEGRPVAEVVELPVSALTRNAATIARLAAEAGFTVRAHGVDGRVMVEGYRLSPPEGFRVSWLGTSPVGTWHEPLRFEMVDDDRPVKVAEKTRTALSGSRAAGVDRRHLRQLSSPHGVNVGVTAVITRLRERASA